MKQFFTRLTMRFLVLILALIGPGLVFLWRGIYESPYSWQEDICEYYRGLWHAFRRGFL